MKNFVIAGAGGFGREVYSYLLNCIENSENKIRGFLDDNPRALDGFGVAHDVISDFASYAPREDDAVIFAVADPACKEALAKILLEKGANIESFAHPSCAIGAGAKIGKGVVIAPFCAASSSAVIEDFVLVNAGTKISCGAKIGKYSTVSSNCVIGENAELKSGAFMASSSVLKGGKTVFEGARLGVKSCAEADIESGKSAFGNPAKAL